MRRLTPSALALAAVLAVAGPALAQDPAPPAPAEAPAVDPESVAALQRMGAYLGTLQNFEITSESSIDLVMTDDQKIDLDGVTTYQVRRPNGFVIENKTDRKQRRYIYDGSQFTVYAPTRKVYATVPAPATIGEVLDTVSDLYGVELPLANLFSWSDPANLPQDLTSGQYIGTATVDGVEADQYAFRGADMDWQIWIQKGEQPVPLKFTIVDRTDSTLPEYTARLKWNLNPTFEAQTFAFSPASDDMAISFVGGNEQ